MYCRNCGSQIDDNAVVCPHCGVATGVNPYYNNANHNNAAPVKQEYNYMALIGFVLSFFFAIAGLVCSIIGYKSVPQYGGNGKNMALAGIIISAISIAISLLVTILIIIGTILGLSYGLTYI